jgi:hypothetical protein
MPKGFRKNISIPGLLATTAKRRAAEFGDAGFAPYVVELVCYDLRAAAHHSITLAIADDTQAAQDAVDQELVARYKPGQPRAGLLVQVAKQLQGIAERSRHDLPLAAMSAVSERVTFPADIWPLAKDRWQALGYRTLSAYITALIRYDLLVGGPHAYATGECRSKVQRAITRKTVAARRKGGQRKILLDHLIERAKGRRVPKDELEEVKAQIARTLRESLTKRP